jgi:hypothetical protein
MIENDKFSNQYNGIAHIDYVKKDTPPYYGLHETASGSIRYRRSQETTLNEGGEGSVQGLLDIRTVGQLCC